MNQLLMIDKAPTMSSLEVAELTGKRHQDVIRDIRNVLEQAEIEAAQFCAPCKLPSGQTSQVYNLPRRECDLVVSGYSVKYRLLNFQQSERIDKTRTSWNRRKQICWHHRDNANRIRHSYAETKYTT